eukprot:15457755-Alexandrium_andersonii.AAC.1
MAKDRFYLLNARCLFGLWAGKLKIVDVLCPEQLKDWPRDLSLQMLRAQLSIDGAGPQSALATRDFGHLSEKHR